MRQLLFLLLWLTAANTSAQVGGTVTDMLSGKPLGKASVSLIRKGKTVKFTRSDDKGSFTIPGVSIEEGDSLQATLMGYAKKRIVAKVGDNRIELEEKSFQLKEVVVKSGPITGRDTITYDLTRFATDRDNSLKDVLKKLPGVDVAESGEISFNGKAISRFTVEGLDLSNGRYNMLTENIRAKDVKKAEVVEHDQPIKVLQKKVPTDNVGMNIELKDSVHDKLSFTLRPYALIGQPTHVGGSATIMQMGKKRQMLYDLAYDRSGKDITQSNRLFYRDFNSLGLESLPTWYTAPTLAAPIDEERLRFNTSQRYSVNHLTKTRRGGENRIKASYSRTVERQHTQNTTSYYMADAAATTLIEDNRKTMTEDQLNLNYQYKTNTDHHYGTIAIDVDANQHDGLSRLESTGHESTTQRVRLPEVNASAEIYRLYTLKRGTMSWKSLADYHFSRNYMYLDTLHSRLNNRLWHTAHEVSYAWSSHLVRSTYAFGMEVSNLNVEHSNAKGDIYLSPAWTYERGRWRVSYSHQLSLSRYFRQRQTELFTTPSLSANYKKSNRTEWQAYVMGGKRAEGWSTFALDSYQSNYRTHILAANFIPTYSYLSSSLTYKYKRPIYEFFMSGSLLASRNWRRAVMDMSIADGNYYYQYIRKKTQSQNASAQISLSKGFYKAHLKTALDMRTTYADGEQYVSGAVIGYSYRSLSLSPQVSFAPSWMQIDYAGTFTVNNSHSAATSLGTLFDHVQRLTLISTINKVDLSVSGIYYHNELNGSPAVNTLLANARVTWRMKRLRLTAELRNVFNKKAYAETSYSGIGIFTNSYELRPRELMVSAQFNL